MGKLLQTSKLGGHRYYVGVDAETLEKLRTIVDVRLDYDITIQQFLRSIVVSWANQNAVTPNELKERILFAEQELEEAATAAQG